MSDSVPDGLADTPTGPGLCTLLGLVELSGVADDRLGDLLVAEARQLAYQQARVWAVMAEIGSRDPMANVPGAVPWPVEQIVESAVEEV